MLLKETESTITNLMQQTSNFISDMIVIHDGRKAGTSCTDKRFSTHPTTVILLEKESLETICIESISPPSVVFNETV